MASAKQRLYQFINAENLTIHAFETKVGLSNGNLSHAKDELSVITIRKIKAAFPKINVSWLTSGKGEMYTTHQNEEVFTTPKQRLLILISDKQLTNYSFERKVGLSNGSVHNAKDDLTTAIIAKVKMAFPDVNAQWLYDGVGDMYEPVPTCDTYTANGDNAIVGKHISITEDSTLRKENDELRTKLAEANEKIRQLQEELITIYRAHVNK